ncbi:cell division protein FtsW [Candidatus Peregrinibacteria bacterium]|nr:cell division protein FtsW [Candidatus Peregrinibacteria bacterium]
MFRRIDLLLLGITVVLTLFGLAMLASVSVYESYQLTLRLYGRGMNSFYLWRTFLHVLFGMGVMFCTSVISYRFWERSAKFLFFATILLLVLVLIPGVNAGWGTSWSWLRIGPFSVQPSEFLKLTMIFYLSVWLQKREQLIGTFKEGFVPFAVLLLISTFLIAIQPDLGSFLVLCTIASVMFFIGGGSVSHMILGGGLTALVGLPIILQKSYIRLRFVAFLFPDDPSIRETFGFQIKQALITIGSGGFFGVGYGKSIQKFGYLPEVKGDMIFSAMAEELGFFRLMIVLSMYGLLVFRGYRIAENAPDRFGFLLAIGITAWIAVQTLINIAVNIGLFPLTGITLPFISYGGSSLVSLLAAIGILLNISMHSTTEASLARRQNRKKLGRWALGA